MVRLVRSQRAKRDIVEVLAYTKERWGVEQACRYADLIEEALTAVADDPACGKARDDIHPGIRALHIGKRGRPARHIVFYRSTSSQRVEIVRLLHEAMDFSRHVT